MLGYEDNYNKKQHSPKKNNTLHKSSNKRREESPSYHAYGTNAAVEFTCEVTKKQSLNTIAMHMATSNKGAKGYDWENKTVIQIPRIELPVVAAVLIRKTKRASFVQNSMMGEKGFTMEHDGEIVRLIMTDSEKEDREIELTPEDVFQISSLFLRQIRSNMNWMSASDIIQLIEQTIVPLKESNYERYNTEDEMPADSFNS